jgi:hypothetical protein
MEIEFILLIEIVQEKKDRALITQLYVESKTVDIIEADRRMAVNRG